MDRNELKKRMDRHRCNVIRSNYCFHVNDGSCKNYSEENAIDGGYNTLISHNLSRDSIREALYSHNMDIAFERVKKKFAEIYNIEVSELNIINNRTMNSLATFYKNDWVFFDRMLEDTLHSFFMIIMLWAKYFDRKDLYGRFFNYLTAVLHDVIIDKGTYNIYDLEYVRKEITSCSNIVNLAVSCQFFCVYFCIAHEVAHKYIEAKGIKLKPKQEEFKADSIAYDIVLRLLLDEKNADIDVKERELFDYCYLAPMMFFDFYDLIFYTNRVLTKTYVADDNIHPEIKKRKENLFSIPYKDQYIFDTEEGNALYSCFLDVVDKYKTELLYRKEKGTVDELIRYMKGEKQ